MSQARHVILRAPNWLGDAVMALPAMVAMRQHVDGQAHDCGKGVGGAAVCRVAGLAADQIVVVDRDARDRPAASHRGRHDRAASELLQERMGRVSQRHRRNDGAIASGGRGWLMTRDRPRPKAKCTTVQFYLGLMRALGIDAPDAVPRLAARASTGQRADTLLVKAGVDLSQPIVSFAAGAAYGHAKRWPPDRVAQVVAGLSARGLQSVLLGAAADRDTARAIESAVPPGVRAIDLVGRTTLTELIGVDRPVGRVRVERFRGDARRRGARDTADGDLRPDQRTCHGPPGARHARRPRPGRVLPTVHAP